MANALRQDGLLAARVTPQAQITEDPVNHPAHYNQGGVECIEAIKAALGQEGFIAYCKGQVVKYLWRADHKGNALQDAEKAEWYLKRAIAEMREKKEAGK